jgi:hypothetical protein
MGDWAAISFSRRSRFSFLVTVMLKVVLLGHNSNIYNYKTSLCVCVVSLLDVTEDTDLGENTVVI